MYTKLLQWFHKEGRALPWREDYSPYSVWVAETMLCQTQVERVIPRYLLWMQYFPDVFTLSKVPLEELLRVWEGLGYYTRPRYMHETAKELVKKFEGKFPEEYNALCKLPGVGRYTACAILSIAYNQPYPAIDGNAIRVFARILDLSLPVETKKAQTAIFDFGASLVQKGEARLVNQAIMDLGAMVCVPRKPRCVLCPVKEECFAFQRNTQCIRPVRRARTRETVEAVIVFYHRDGQVLVRKRPEKGFFGGLWEFPWQENASLDELIFKHGLSSGSVPEWVGEIDHGYCNRQVKARIFFIDVNGWPLSLGGYVWKHIDHLEQYPFSSFHRKAFRLFQKFIMGKRGMNT
ncbi:MAG: A/G-specific adenine glycosylase [Atribacterota bacterium]